MDLLTTIIVTDLFFLLPRTFFLYLNTLRHLKLTQGYYYLYYFLLRKFRAYAKRPGLDGRFSSAQLVEIIDPICYDNTSFRYQYLAFTFLNFSKSFNHYVDWNYSYYGKLWAYNLNYFEFLFQSGLSRDTGLSIIRNYVSSRETITIGLEPYCVSVRVVQWIKFLNLHSIHDDLVNRALHSDVRLLEKRIEFHLMANHVLENAFALTVASAYFRDVRLFHRSKKLLLDQLAEQIMGDGCHYERSPMYQCTLSNRLLDVINVVSHSRWIPGDFTAQLKGFASRMLAWLENIHVHDRLPAFQDCSNTMPFKVSDLRDYADRLHIERRAAQLTDSKYRRMALNGATIIADVGAPSPSYQPGHAHAGALSFVVFHGATPLVVDPGVSTYERSATRLLEKSTSYHNTVEVRGMNQSEIWGSFRMGSRAEVNLKEDLPKKVVAELHGYAGTAIRHTREFDTATERLIIRDSIIAPEGKTKGIFYLHFHPSVQVRFDSNTIVVGDHVKISFVGAGIIEEGSYNFAVDFNARTPAPRALVHFYDELTSEFTFL